MMATVSASKAIGYPTNQARSRCFLDEILGHFAAILARAESSEVVVSL